VICTLQAHIELLAWPILWRALMLATPTERAPLLVSNKASVTFLCHQYASGSSLATKSPRGQERCRLQHRQPPPPRRYRQIPVAEQPISRLLHRTQHLALTAKLSMVLMVDNTLSAAHLTQVETVEPIGPIPSRQETSHNVSLSATKMSSVAHGCGAEPVAQESPEAHASSNRRLSRQFQGVETSLLAF
jgi:hypothetical protein